MPTEELKNELKALEARKLVSTALESVRAAEAALPPIEALRVGVTFRTDSRGQAHETWDKVAVIAIMGLLGEVGKKLPFGVEPVTLPRGARGETIPARKASWFDLDDIDLLYIPGAPTAVDSQEATTPVPKVRVTEDEQLRLTAINKEEQDLSRALDPGVKSPTLSKNKAKEYEVSKRKFEEHQSRACYELDLIRIARHRGIPILAICAGSWRLLEAYGGKVRTLPKLQRERHKHTESSQIWELTHTLRALKDRTTIVKGLAGGYYVMSGVNSTHWAVASTTRERGDKLATKKNASEKPYKMLEVSAMDPVTKTVEAFESRFGAPVLGIQWHPESYLPGMPGENDKKTSTEIRNLSQALFKFMIHAAYQSRLRRTNVGYAINRITEDKVLHLLADCARKLGNDMVELKQALAPRAQAVELLPETSWTERLMEVSVALDELVQYRRLMEEKKLVGAGNAYKSAFDTLKGLGILI